AGITGFLFVFIMVASDDLGVALQYLLIFVIMAFVGGVNILWFLGGFAALVVAAPFLWRFLGNYQQQRILVLFDPTIDPHAQGVRYQTNYSLRALQNGGITGQGLYNGTMVQAGILPQQRNDFIFSSIGEELGMLGCVAVLLILAAIIVRIIHVGVKSENYMNRLICVGIAGMLFSQILINVGMCLGLFPVVGLTLPFFSYGGSSIVTMFLAMGIVSGIKMHPAPDSNARYIRPKL
ncbi:MAG: FtsW/RodA/SpoVE family cell cycle protein, partial [Clostridia bacterium]|nr:FtsW/RodA/SpoVE family cell cycle protein [Clostridia bacterium]